MNASSTNVTQCEFVLESSNIYVASSASNGGIYILGWTDSVSAY
jgi:hypothetical protein